MPGRRRSAPPAPTSRRNTWASDGARSGRGAVPIEYVFPRPGKGVRAGCDVGDRLAEVGEAGWGAHDVGVNDERHDAHAIIGIAEQLLELVDRPIAVFASLVVLDQHHRHVVALLGIGNAEDWAGARLQRD